MGNRLKFVSVVIAFFVAISCAQGLSSTEIMSGEVIFSNNFPDPESGQLNAILALKGGGTLSVGKNGVFDARSRLVWLDLEGQITRDMKLEIGGDSGLTSVSATPDGGFVAVGFAEHDTQKDWNVLVLRLSNSGERLWQKTYGGEDKDKAEAVRVADNGDIVIAGWTRSKGAGDYDGWVLRLNKAGDLLWDKTYGDSKTEIIKDFVFTDDGGLTATGYTSSLGAGFLSGAKLGLHESTGYAYAKNQEVENGWVLRLDRTGAKLWERTLGGRAYDTMDKIIAYRNDFVVVGHTKSNGQLAGNAWAARLNGNGKIVWELSLGEPEHTDTGVGLTQLPNGDIVLGGKTTNSAGLNYAWLKTLTSDGEMVAETRHHFQKYVDLDDLALLPNGNIAFVGRAKNPQTNKMNALAISVTLPKMQ